jgi:hypothetical protein
MGDRCDRMTSSSGNNPRTNLAEAAIYQIAMRMEDYRVLTYLDEKADTFRHTLLSTDQLRSGNALVDVVAVVENFVSQRVLAACPSLNEDDVFSWPKRQKAWLAHLNVDFVRLQRWNEVKGYIQVRNALQHGLGRLTESQLGKWRDETLLVVRSSRGIDLKGDRIYVSSEAVASCADACRGLILELDQVN